MQVSFCLFLKGQMHSKKMLEKFPRRNSGYRGAAERHLANQGSLRFSDNGDEDAGPVPRYACGCSFTSIG